MKVGGDKSEYSLRIETSLLLLQEVFDVASLPSIRVAQCAVVIDRTKVVIGFADVGMYCVELDRDVSMISKCALTRRSYFDARRRMRFILLVLLRRLASKYKRSPMRFNSLS